MAGITELIFSLNNFFLRLISKLPFFQRKAIDSEAREGTDRAGIAQPREEEVWENLINVYEQVMGAGEKEGVGLVTGVQ